MKVKVGLIIFAAGRDYSVLLRKRPDFCYEIPSEALPEDKDGISIVCEITKESLGISASWDELEIRQLGTFDAIERNPIEREIFIAYGMFIPTKIKCREDCGWVKINELPNQKIFLDHEDIIRYSILGGNNVF